MIELAEEAVSSKLHVQSIWIPFFMSIVISEEISFLVYVILKERSSRKGQSHFKIFCSGWEKEKKFLSIEA